LGAKQELGADHPLSLVIKLGIRHLFFVSPDKKERKKAIQSD
jgi:hypothetical protein